MSDKKIKTRIQQKHDIEANWEKAVAFVPMAGEIIVYDAEVDGDGNALALPGSRLDAITYERFKIGNGYTTINELPFADAKVYEEIISTRADMAAIKQVQSGEGMFSEIFNNSENTASGEYSHAEGTNTEASGNYSHAEGQGTTASGYNSHAEGCGTVASGGYSHAEGNCTTVSGDYSHAEGENTTASGTYAHSEGYCSTASGNCSHAEGAGTSASESYAHAEGYSTTASGYYAHAEGKSDNTVANLESMLEMDFATLTDYDELSSYYNYMQFSMASGEASHIEGTNTVATATASHAEGISTIATGEGSHTEGHSSVATATAAHAEGGRTIASGTFAHSEGCDTEASGDYSHAEGQYSYAGGDYSHAEGNSYADGSHSHAEGCSSAYGDNSHAEGGSTEASGDAAHSEGQSTRATGMFSHAEGCMSEASGEAAHAEGDSTLASGSKSHAEGSSTIASGDYSHVEGSMSEAPGYCAHAEGSSTYAYGSQSHAEGGSTCPFRYAGDLETIDADSLKGLWKTTKFSFAFGEASHVEGTDNLALENNAHAEGVSTIAEGICSHTEGSEAYAKGKAAHAEGTCMTAYGESSHAAGVSSTRALDISDIDFESSESVKNAWNPSNGGELFALAYGKGSSIQGGSDCLALGNYSSTTGICTAALGNCSCASGDYSVAVGDYSHAEGDVTIAYGYGSHAEGGGTTAFFEHGFENSYEPVDFTDSADLLSKWASSSAYWFSAAYGNFSHVEGSTNLALGYASHAENEVNLAFGRASHAEGHYTKAMGEYSHAEGYHTRTAATGCQHVQGHYNRINAAGSNSGTDGDAFVIGNGVSENNGSNALRVTYAGGVFAKAAYNATGADYAEYFEWADGNPNKEDRRGYFVTMQGDKIALAKPGDYIIGVISGRPAIIGNSDEEWQGRYIMDEFGDFITEEFEYEEKFIDEETKEETIVVKTGTRYKQNPDYDPDRAYIQRADRQEWAPVGMMGVLSVRDDGTCQVNGYCEVTEDSTATASESGYRVIKRVNDHIVKIIFAVSKY